MKELWTSVPTYENLYEVSNLGRVRSFHKQKLTYLNPSTNTDGYYFVALYKNKIHKSYKIHRLVACSFLGKPLDCDDVVNHINGIKIDNRLSNLEFASIKENVIHALKTGLIKTKLTHNQVRDIRELLEKNELSISEISRMYGVSRQTISGIKDNKTYQYYDTPLPKSKKNSKLTERQIVEIRDLLLKNELSQKQISEIYGVGQSAISKIKLYKRHG